MTSNNNESFWFIFYNDTLLLEKKTDTYTIPRSIKAPFYEEGITIHHITILQKIPCHAFSVNRMIEESDQFIMVNLRASYDYIEESLYKIAGKAHEILHWDKNSKYCPACGIRTLQSTPICKKCPQCQQEFYPVISTAIIVLIRKENSILLVRARNFRGNFHGLIAGFLETGESLEECVKREVMEETGLSIKNITYFGNQPWPYPSGLMIGFIADYDSGSLILQEEELSTGAFFTKDHLPELPRKLSIARKMVDWWLTQE